MEALCVCYYWLEMHGVRTGRTPSLDSSDFRLIHKATLWRKNPNNVSG
jgi:hypothetical protein